MDVEAQPNFLGIVVAIGIALVTGGYLLFYFLVAVQGVRLECKDGSHYKELLESGMPMLKEKYRPTFWAIGNELQFMIKVTMRPRFVSIFEGYRREVFKLEDGGVVGLDWLDSSSRDMTVLVVHGLLVHSRLTFTSCLINAIQSTGSRCVFMNMRGSSGLPLKTPRTYGAHSFDDVSEVVDHIKSLHPNSLLIIVGSCYGAIMVHKYLEHMGERAREKLAAAFFASPPYSWKHTTERLDSRWPWTIHRHIARKLLVATLKKKIKQGWDLFSRTGIYDYEAIMSSKSIADFERTFTMRQFGFNSMRDYYEAAELAPSIGRIKIPVLALISDDDYVCPKNCNPIEEIRSSDRYALVRTRFGGHDTFYEGFIPQHNYGFKDRLFCQFLEFVATHHQDLVKPAG